MANDLNRVTLIGRMTKDPEISYTRNGTSVTKFSLANNSKYNDKESVSYFNCLAWGKLGEIIEQFTSKGSRVAIEGRVKQNTWDGDDGKKRSNYEVTIEFIQFLDTKERQEHRQREPHPDSIINSGTEVPSSDIPSNPFSDDNIPF